jgi:hypothetical protein|tara:strand:- start:1429 stop:1587 length:159 start_codon:yes stop_codon:yes gene_type:complete
MMMMMPTLFLKKSVSDFTREIWRPFPLARGFALVENRRSGGRVRTRNKTRLH